MACHAKAMLDVELDFVSDVESLVWCEADAETCAPQPLNEAEAEAFIDFAKPCASF